MSGQLCPRCGRPVALDAPGNLCAACLLEAGAETFSAGSGSTDFMPTMSSAAAAVVVRGAPRLNEGDRWGGYRIGRLLGRGGMGEVYDAEHVASGRRVALKVLSSPLQSAEERARFLREGQLAASVSHPHTVYIFGSEEIDGTPVISMELLPGGTLKDRIVAGGPMAPGDAVAAIMDVIGGLDAAAAVGILHRDIKPSNCFVDNDGVVKIGDFGLSISTLARDVHQQLVTSGFEGTPQFAPPEQLRGEPLDVRADIYAVGATLYYLLTGRAPFDAPDLRELFARVTSDAAVAPRQLRPEIPARLSALVMQCLAKTPADRPASYPALADALRPFVVREDRPAPLLTRMIAYVLESWIIVGLPIALVTTWIADPISGSPVRTASITGWAWLATFAYFLVIEGATGASLAKRLFGMRVVSADGSQASLRQIVLRTLMFFLPSMSLSISLAAGLLADSRFDYLRSGVAMALSAGLFFSTARRRNGWTGLHEVISRTRVVARPSTVTRSRIAQQPPLPALPLSAKRYGPFVAEGGEHAPGAVVRAFDPVLRRQVWIQLAAPSAPPISAARRDLARTGRLHWLTGRRSPEESWDAYEAPDGVSWAAASVGIAWAQTKLQLLDLTEELSRASEDGTLPPLAIDRVWVRENGRVLLLDFAAPGSPFHPTAAMSPEQLLRAVVARVPRNAASPEDIPLSGRSFLERWSRPSLPSLQEARAALRSMVGAPNGVAWWRRALPSALTAAPIALMLLVGFLILPMLSRFASSDTSAMMNLLGVLQSRNLPADNPMRRPEVREAAEVAIAGRYGSMIRDDSFWDAGIVRGLAPQYRSFAEEILRRHPDVSAEQLADAERVLAASRREFEARQATARPAARRQQSVVEIGGVIISTVTAGAVALVLVCLVLSALLVPGGIVSRQLGLATVSRTGQEIGRLRSVARALVIGVPGIAWFVYLGVAPKVQGFVPTPRYPLTATLLTVGVLALGAIWTIARRTRGPHDILTGTWVVPR